MCLDTELLPIKEEHKLLYYLNLCISQNIDVRSLRIRIKSKEYERLPEQTKNNLISSKQIAVVIKESLEQHMN